MLLFHICCLYEKDAVLKDQYLVVQAKLYLSKMDLPDRLSLDIDDLFHEEILPLRLPPPPS